MGGPVLTIPLPYGEVVDRIVILDLKVARMSDPGRRTQAAALREALGIRWDEAGLPPLGDLPEFAELMALNATLWDVEDALRAHEQRNDFGDSFVSLARRVYVTNDRRSAVKAAIDRRLASPFHEPKSHA